MALTQKKAAANFLMDVILAKQNKVIITSRYFPDFLDKKINTFEIAPLTNQEILEFLKNSDVLTGTDKSNMEVILQNLRMFNTPLLLMQVISLNNYAKLPIENITLENVFYATYMQYASEQREHLENLAFYMFSTQKVNVMLNDIETEKMKEYREIYVNEGKVSFVHSSLYELFLAKKIFDKLFLHIETFESSAIDTFSNGMFSVQTFEYIKMFISKSKVSHKDITKINEKFTKMLEDGFFSKMKNNAPVFQEIANVFYSTWHLVLYINKYFLGKCKFNNSGYLEKNLVCLIDIFNKFYFDKKFLDFSNVNLESFNLWRCNAISINFKNSILRCVNFRSSQLEGSNFENADMTKCQLVGSNMQNVNLQNAILEDANIARCIVSECSLPDILKYKYSLKGLDLLIINMGKGEYMTFSQYKKLYT